MASKYFQPTLVLTKTSCVWWREGLKLYSQYAPRFKEPIIDKEQIDKIIAETPKEEIRAWSIKASRNSQTTSIFYDDDIRKFTNYVMKSGQKEMARHLVEGAFTYIKHHQLRLYNKETDKEKKEEIILSPQKVFHLAVHNCTPLLNVKKIKKSGSWYKIPVGVTPSFAKFLAMRWIVHSAREKDPKTEFKESLGKELVDAANEQGKAYKKKVELHKLCEANRSYAHYTWG